VNYSYKENEKEKKKLDINGETKLQIYHADNSSPKTAKKGNDMDWKTHLMCHVSLLPTAVKPT
jgi:hypothetical protein